MSRRLSVYVLVVAALASCLAAAWPATAAKKRSARSDRAIERRVDALLSKVTLEEKLDQLTLMSDGQMKDNPAEARKPVGGVFSETDPKLINAYQHDAVEHSRLHIPILFAFDTIHGFRTIFPIPLGTPAASTPPSLGTTTASGPSSRRRSGSSRSTARWSTSRTSP